MKSAAIRSAFFDFFQARGHQWVASSPLVPADDPTLLFTNAGMNQFKAVFLNQEQLDYTRAVSAQKCVRAGGKHNDLDNVGYTARHHTFFEMLGNFSFGDYFKREAIQYAWDFLTQILGLPAERLWVTVYQEDQEAERIWLDDLKIDPQRFSRLGENDNFWSMGDTGPCGPCSEIFYDHGATIAGDPPGGPQADGDRYVEIWNMVFMQFNRTAEGVMQPLAKPSIDTGMGLERIAAVMQGVHNNYETDLFQPLLAHAACLLGGVATTDSALRVIADHIRSCAFLVADGIIPSNEGRGYALRRIIRRACRHGHKLGAKAPFFHQLVPTLVANMGAAYPALKAQQTTITDTLHQEEVRFAHTLDKGISLLEGHLNQLSSHVIPGDVVFNLYDTYGFPVDLVADIAREHHKVVDQAGFDQALAAQRARARATRSFKVDYDQSLTLAGTTDFTGYDHLHDTSQVQALWVDGQSVAAIDGQQQALVVLDKTPFYGEAGGQVGDRGVLLFTGGSAQVQDTQKQGNHHIHQVQVDGPLTVGTTVSAQVDAEKRWATTRNHSATHLLHAALRQVLGQQVRQQGSRVDAERLRFDFSHTAALTTAQWYRVERLVNEQIRANTPVVTELLDRETANQRGAMALFDEKYGDQVRVLTMGTDHFSVELCGGTHVQRTGDIGAFRLVVESGVAAGVRRVEAITGELADQWQQSLHEAMNKVSTLVRGHPDNVVAKVQALLTQQRQLEKTVQQLQQRLAQNNSTDLLTAVVEVKGIKLLATTLAEAADAKSLRTTVDQLKHKLGTGIILLATPTTPDKVLLAAGVTHDLTHRIKASDVAQRVATQLGGQGGGRADFAQGGGTQVEQLPAALQALPTWLAEQL